jgi:hypothetical protein
LRQRGVTSAVLQTLQDCTERAEFARYAPGADTSKARKELLESAAQAINGIETTFGKGKKA